MLLASVTSVFCYEDEVTVELDWGELVEEFNFWVSWLLLGVVVLFSLTCCHQKRLPRQISKTKKKPTKPFIILRMLNTFFLLLLVPLLTFIISLN